MTDITAHGQPNLVLFKGLDTLTPITPYLPKCDDIDFFGRYIKNYSTEEHAAIKARGKHVLLIQESTADRTLQGELAGRTDGQAAVARLSTLGLFPTGKSALFVAVDTDVAPDDQPHRNAIIDYFAAFDETLWTYSWAIGGYASGTILQDLTNHNLAYKWVAGAWGWSGTRSYLNVTPPQWDIIQGATLNKGGTWPTNGVPGVTPIHWPDIGTPYDPNIARSLDWAL